MTIQAPFRFSYLHLRTVILLFRTKKESFVYQTKDSFFELSVPYGTISTPSVREAMLRIVKCLRAWVDLFHFIFGGIPNISQ